MPLFGNYSLEKFEVIRKLLKILILAFLAFVCFALLSGFLLCLAHLSRYGFTTEQFNLVGKFLWGLVLDPFKIFYAYESWGKTLATAYNQGSLNWGMFLPILAPIVVILITIWVVFCSIFKRFNIQNHFATESDIQKTGLYNGSLMYLGKVDEEPLRLDRTCSTFVYGKSGLGKTSGVVIPSILETDKASIVAVDNSGILAKYTSGHRAKLGKVFYFDWRLTDDPEKGQYWPRWNPLSYRNLPKGGAKRERYMLALTKSLLSQDKKADVENYWDRLSHVALHGLLRFFIAKIEQANANDYFLNKIAEKGSVFREDRELLLSYCIMMPEKISKPIIDQIKSNKLNYDNYVPIGSWGGVPEEWQGKEMCLPMFLDFIIQRYFLIVQKNKNSEVDSWKMLLEEFLEEAAFFGYNSVVIQELRQLFYLSKKQRNIVFPIVFKPLMVFRNKIVRERTCLSDFYLRQSRGIKTAQGVWQPTTIYNVYNNDYMSRFFVDMLIEDALLVHRSAGGYPIVFVMDDLAKVPVYNSLVDGVQSSLGSNISFLLVSNNLLDIKNLYGMERIENIIGGATYKVIVASGNEMMAEELENMALFGTKSVQIPCVSSNVLRIKKGLADASYYRRIAQGLNNKTEVVFSKGSQMVLAEGFYHRPIKAHVDYFLNNENMKERSQHRPIYFVPLDILKNRKEIDLVPPLLINVLKSSGIKIEKGEEVDEFIDRNFREAIEYSKMVPDKESALRDEILNRWGSKKAKKTKPENTKIDGAETNDWWMTEECFVVPEDKTNNDDDKSEENPE